MQRGSLTEVEKPTVCGFWKETRKTYQQSFLRTQKAFAAEKTQNFIKIKAFCSPGRH